MRARMYAFVWVYVYRSACIIDCDVCKDMCLCECMYLCVYVRRYGDDRITDYSNNSLMHYFSLSAHFEKERDKTRRQACKIDFQI